MTCQFNRTFLAGRLTRDPDDRTTPKGVRVAEIRLASNHTSGRGDDKKQDVCFVDVTFYGRTAEVAIDHLAKGREILVEGRLQHQQWETANGEKRSKHRILGDRFQFLGSAPNRPEPRATSGSEFNDDLPF